MTTNQCDYKSYVLECDLYTTDLLNGYFYLASVTDFSDECLAFYVVRHLQGTVLNVQGILK